MRLHRFYIEPERLELRQSIWVNEDGLKNQWLKVLRYRVNDQLVLFDGVETERLYKITIIEPQGGIKLDMVTEFERKLPDRHIYLFFSLLKKDKNDWVLQKCTELGVRSFVPIIADRSEKTGFNEDRAKKIVIEAAEQCGRSDIPIVREPVKLQEALGTYRDELTLLVAEKTLPTSDISDASEKPVGIFIGPEGGWTESELEQFKEIGAGQLNLGQLTLRAETAAIAAVTKLA